MPKEETVLQGVIDKLIEIGRCCVMEINVEKNKSVRISRQSSPVTIMIDQKNWRMWNVLNIWVAYQHMMEYIHVKLNPEFPIQKVHSTAYWT